MADNDDECLTKTSNKNLKPRTEKQQEAFKKCLDAKALKKQDMEDRLRLLKLCEEVEKDDIQNMIEKSKLTNTESEDERFEADYAERGRVSKLMKEEAETKRLAKETKKKTKEVKEVKETKPVNKKQPKIVYQDETDEESEPEIIIVKKKKSKKSKQIIIESESDTEDEYVPPNRSTKSQQNKVSKIQVQQPEIKKIQHQYTFI
jgi:hypothetical protein